MPPSVYPTGVTVYDPDKAYNCYVLIDTRDGCTSLIDMNGHLVNRWEYNGFPSEMLDPVLRQGRRGEIVVQKEPDIYGCETLYILDWGGQAIWEWGSQAPGGKARQNHDQCLLPNGNLLALCFIDTDIPKGHGSTWLDQAIYEITPSGDIVWTWIASEHIEELGFTGEKKELLLSPAGRPRSSIFVLNDMQALGPNRFYPSDTRFHPDNIMIDSREACFLAILEKATGRVVWRMGPEYPASYDNSQKAFSGPLPRRVDSIAGQHDAHLIPEGLPGAGNVMVFDNQGASGFPPVYLEMFPGSRVLEIDPVRREIVWQYDASRSGQPFWTFFSSFISSARRLPNGNTLICEGMHGRSFQVTIEGEIVWEYVSPVFGQWADHDVDSGGRLSNYTFRAQPIPYDWVPEGTPRSEQPVSSPELPAFRVP